MEPDLSKLNFWSGANYMKRVRDDTPYTDVFIAGSGSATLVVDHDLGHIPEFNVDVDLQANGRIWTGTKPYVDMASSGTPDAVYYDCWIDTADLTILLHNPSGSSITVRVYHIIYKDYA